MAQASSASPVVGAAPSPPTERRPPAHRPGGHAPEKDKGELGPEGGATRGPRPPLPRCCGVGGTAAGVALQNGWAGPLNVQDTPTSGFTVSPKRKADTRLQG